MTVQYSVNAPDVDRLQKMLARYPQVSEQVIRKALTEIVMTVRGQVVNEMHRPVSRGGGAASVPINQGRLVGSIGGRVEMLGGKVKGIVGTTVEYAPYVEQGRRPGRMPPLDAIERWCHLKLGDGSLAYVVARSIARRGTQGYFMFARAWKNTRQWVSQRLAQSLKEIVEALKRGG